MNNIITMRRLVEIMAQQSGIPAEQIDRFLKNFTALIAETLAGRQSASINGVGEFSVAANGKIMFKPDEALAKDINSPFDIFQPEVLADSITVEQLNQPLSTEPAAPEVPQPEPAAEPELEPEPEPEPQPAPVPLPEATIASEPAQAKPEPQQYEESCEEEQYEESYAEEPYAEDYREAKFPAFWTIIGLLVGLILGIGIGFFMHDPIEKLLEPSLEDEQTEIIEAEEMDFDMAEPADAAPAVDDAATTQQAAQPAVADTDTLAQNANPQASEVKYETVKPGTSLANLAKKHYGERSYWVYIYLENQKAIKNPNRIPQGTRLVIPPIEKYATQATQAERLDAARKKVSEVLSKYPN